MFRTKDYVINICICQYRNTTGIEVLENDNVISLGEIYKNNVAKNLYNRIYPVCFHNNHKQREQDFLIEEALYGSSCRSEEGGN